MFDIVFPFLLDILFYPVGYIFLKLVTLGKFKTEKKYNFISTSGCVVFFSVVIFISIL